VGMKDIKAKTKAVPIIKQTQMGTFYTWVGCFILCCGATLHKAKNLFAKTWI